MSELRVFEAKFPRSLSASSPSSDDSDGVSSATKTKLSLNDDKDINIDMILQTLESPYVRFGLFASLRLFAYDCYFKKLLNIKDLHLRSMDYVLRNM